MASLNPPNHEDRKQEIVGVYDRAAGTYDQVGIRTATYFGHQLVESLAVPSGAKVLDVATGRGALLFAAAQKTGPAGKVIGIDLAPGMVAATAAEIRVRRLQQAEVLLMDGDDPTFPHRSFDYILCGFALHFLDYPHALQNFRELLKSGGTFAAVVPYVPIDNSQDMERWQWLSQLTRAVFSAAFKPPAAWVAANRLNNPELITAALQDAGFEQISAWREEKEMYFLDEEDWWAWEWSQASRFWLEGMSPEGLAKFKTGAFENLQRIKTPQGIPTLWGALFCVGKALHPASEENLPGL
jgi:ubiquinone/menaquinone biosynthesis C-methylase UbiE